MAAITLKIGDAINEYNFMKDGNVFNSIKELATKSTAPEEE